MDALRHSFLILLFSAVILKNFGACNITSNVLNTLRLEHCNQSDIIKIKDAENVKELTIHDCNLTTLESDVFTNFGHLSVLQITNSEFGNLSNSTFIALKLLRSLFLSDNNITVAHSWTTEPLTALGTLVLRCNSIKQLENNCFAYYPNLQSLDLSCNLLKTLNGSDFVKLPYLKYLNLGENHLSYLNATAFEGLQRMIHLNLSHNKLENIDKETFVPCMHLRLLSLEYNELKTLRFLKAKHLQRLEHLNLTRNNIEDFDTNSFVHYSELITLDLSWNFFRKLDKDSLMGLKSLEYFNMSYNQLYVISPGSFEELFALREINLSYNNLSSIPATLFRTTSLLERINLAQNKLITVNDMLFTTLPYLTYINLSGNKLSNAAFTAHFATALQDSKLTLNLSDNLFQEEMLNLTKLAKFERVELAGNHWSCLGLIAIMQTFPKSLYFGHRYENLSNSWNIDMLNSTRYDCNDGQQKRSIIILQLPCNAQSTQLKENSPNANCCVETTFVPQNPSPPPLVWPRIRMDKFDSRSVIIWMLIAIAIAFAGLRVARHLMDEKDGKKLFRRFKHQQSNSTEMEVLHSPDDNSSRNWNFNRYEQLEKRPTPIS